MNYQLMTFVNNKQAVVVTQKLREHEVVSEMSRRFIDRNWNFGQPLVSYKNKRIP